MIDLAKTEETITLAAHQYLHDHPEQTVPTAIALRLRVKQLVLQELDNAPQGIDVNEQRGQLLADIVKLMAIRLQEKAMKRFAKYEAAQ
ncbi:hypothetical protein [Pseudomonas sp. VI4.1]|uniref:hypothetical protein n=1 Tax=Pseudomonas sp. VI4.1 TaxID=1941346 RepID=UPI0009CA30AD|nr:hypothetical protein [Pseudomonas sp. VI4.1]OPK06119.1 hypothetical protein BZ163_33770 [Pseudomonas sp. VI4.1]